MALRAVETTGAPEPGHILLVVHDFSARSSDELSLSKGDRVELIERDDEFGDGWFLGRHLINGKSGLFPEVYTRIAPRGSLICSPASLSISNPPLTTKKANTTTTSNVPYTRDNKHSLLSESLTAKDAPQIKPTIAPQGNTSSSNLTGTTLPEATIQSKTISSVNIKGHRQDSPVMNETLSVINEHITNLNSPHGIIDRDRQLLSDSGSEYSSQADVRQSYINGEETDQDEEETLFSREQVANWTSEEVSEHLFARGVEPKHCEILRDQEITGDVLLDMDQATIFLKEFDFGSVGRRLKTWQRIKSIQDEVGSETSSKRNTSNYVSELGEENGRNRSQNTSLSNTLPRASSVHDSQVNSLNPRLSNQNSMWNESAQALISTSKISHEICYSDGDKSRYSTGARDQYHSRQNSSNQTTTNLFANNVVGTLTSTQASHERTHPKRGSFDRNWTMQNSTSPSYSSQSLSMNMKASKRPSVRSSIDNLFNMKTSDSSIDLFGSNYFSSNEVENGARSASRRRQSPGMNVSSRSRRSSLTEYTMNSRFGSVDSSRDAPPHSAAEKYYGTGVTSARHCTPSENPISISSKYEVENGVRSASRRRESPHMNVSSQSRRSSFTEYTGDSRLGSVDSIRDASSHSATGKYYSIDVASAPHRTPSETPIPTSSKAYFSKDQAFSVSPKITKLEDELVKSLDARQDKNDFKTSIKSASIGRLGLRAISSAVTGHEKSRAIHPPPELNLNLPLKFSPIQSPPRTGSTTPSGGFSFNLESPDLKSASNHSNLNSNGRIRKKTKKETSAYTRGLEKKKPQEAILSADYSGWMKKKSTNLMASWKPRLFVLKGRRLSYYYSENDEEERGLIDISFHRVLPADNDRLTGLHATLTGATHTKTYVSDNATSMAHSATEQESEPDKGNDSVFIFKLVPPKAGLQRAVTFTKPTIHYFAVPNIKQGRLWMAALMKATIERDETVLLKSTYQQKTISLTKARAMRHRPPALMNLKGDHNVDSLKNPANDDNCLDISGIVYNTDPQEGDSGVSGVSNSNSHLHESLNRGFHLDIEKFGNTKLQPNSS